MRAWPLHVVFATILVGSLAAKERVADMLLEVDNADLETSVVRVAQSQGLAFQQYLNVGYLPAVAFEAPGCSRPVLAILRVSFDLDVVVESAHERGDELRYAYIGRTWEKPDRLAFFIERMKYAALATFGLTRYVPSGHLLLVDSPSQCPAAAAIDWRNVWNRDYFAAGAADTEATLR